MGSAVMCDGRLLHSRAAVTGNALSPTVDRRVRRTSRDVDEAERVVVVWIQCLLVDVANRIIANGQPVNAALLGRRCMCTHQTAALFCVK